MTKSIVYLVALLLLSACSIEPMAVDDPGDPGGDRNEPGNGSPDKAPTLTYIACGEVRACAGLADCFGVFAQLCEAPTLGSPDGGFYCGDERATLHIRGSLECGEAIVAAIDCCADIDAAYSAPEGGAE